MSFGDAQFVALPLALTLGGVVAFAAVKIAWGVAIGWKKSQFRVGALWGSEHIEVTEWSGREGHVEAGGELWRARSSEVLQPGEAVRVLAVTGLLLDVARLKTKGE